MVGIERKEYNPMLTRIITIVKRHEALSERFNIEMNV